MSFKTKWVCMDCGTAIWDNKEPDEWECSCYIEPKEVKKKDIMGPKERKERYREQYKLNNFTWNNKSPYMFMDEFNGYPKRNHDE